MPARAAFRIVIPLLICLALAGRPALGAQAVEVDDERAAAPVDTPDAVAPAPQRAEPARHGRVAVMSLYVSFATLQGLDAHSTLRAAEFGGLESNPALGRVVGSPAAVVAAKAAATAGVVFASERLWKRNKTAAIVMMIALNSAYGAMVAHNYAVEAAAGRVRR